MVRNFDCSRNLQSHRCLSFDCTLARAHAHIQALLAHIHTSLFWAALWSTDMQGGRRATEKRGSTRSISRQAAAAAQEFSQVSLS